MSDWKTEKWWVSPFNYDSDYTNSRSMPQKVQIHDATLRDGEQTPGVVLTIEEKVRIAQNLDKLGVDRIEAGMPAVSEQDQEAIRQIVGLGLNSKIFSFSRALIEDIDLASDLGVDGVIIEIPTSVPKLKYQFPKWSNEDVIDKSIEVTKYAKEKGLYTVYFGYDTTRADWDFLIELYDRLMKEAKPDAIGVVDTMGCILPGAMYQMVKKLKQRYDVPIEVHTHNDFGLGVGISFAALEAGAEVIHTCVNGMGERTGNAPLEPILVGLSALYGFDTNYNLDFLKETSDLVEELTNFKRAVNQPIVGDHVYVRESGIGIDLVLQTPLAMFAVVPELSGNKAGVVLGKKSGLKSIDVYADELGLEPLNADLKARLLNQIKNLSINEKRTLSKAEFKDMYEGVKNENI